MYNPPTLQMPDNYKPEQDEQSIKEVLETEPAEETTEPTPTGLELSKEEPTEPEPSVEAQPEPPRETRHFKQLREQNERIQKELEDAKALLYQQQNYQQQRYAQQPVKEEEYEYNGSEDDLVEGKHLKKMASEIKRLKSDQRNKELAMEERLAEVVVRAKYSDFDRVVTKENIALARQLKPSLMRAVDNSPDSATKYEAAYDVIKELNTSIEKEEKAYQPQTSLYQKQKNIMEKNSLKPKLASSISAQTPQTPLQRASIFSDSDVMTDDLADYLNQEIKKNIERMHHR